MSLVKWGTLPAFKDWNFNLAVTVAPEFRRMGLAATFMKKLEEISEKFLIKNCKTNLSIIPRKDCYFVDLFVRVSNHTAISMYKRLGYVVYRRIIDYYSGDVGHADEDAYGWFGLLEK